MSVHDPATGDRLPSAGGRAMSVASDSAGVAWRAHSPSGGAGAGAGAGAGEASVVPHAALASVGRALQNIFERYSGSAMRRVVGVADEYGVDGLYVAFIIMRERTVWPKMRSEDRQALEVVARLM